MIPSGFEIWESLGNCKDTAICLPVWLVLTSSLGSEPTEHEEQNWGRNVSRFFQTSQVLTVLLATVLEYVL